jgi:hypothetical protein
LVKNFRRDIPRHIVTFRVTARKKTEKSELPTDRAIRMGIVRAEVPRLDSDSQVAAERGDNLCNPLDSFFDPLCDG